MRCRSRLKKVHLGSPRSAGSSGPSAAWATRTSQPCRELTRTTRIPFFALIRVLITVNSRPALFVVGLPSGDRRHKRDLVPFLEFVILAQETNLFVVHVDVLKPQHMALFVTQVRLELRKTSGQGVQQTVQVASSAAILVSPFGMTPEGAGNGNCHAHLRPLLTRGSGAREFALEILLEGRQLRCD